MKEKDLTKKVLEKVANELNKAMDFENPIEVADDMTDIDLLRSDIIEAARELRADDEITEETKEVLIFLDIKLPWKVKKEVKKDVKKPVKKEVKKDVKKPVKKEVKKDVKKPIKKEVEKDVKKPIKKEVEKDVKKGQAKNKKDEFGFSLKSKNSIFAATIKKIPMTMAKINKEKWNDKGGTYYSAWKALVEMGAGQKTEDGKMSIKKNWKK